MPYIVGILIIMKGYSMNFILMAFLFFIPTFGVLADSDPAVQAQQAQEFVSRLGDDAITTLDNTKGDQSARREEFKRILNDNFDMSAIGQFALGRYWATATDAEKSEYLTLFKDMVIDVYTQRFSDYYDQKFIVTGSNPSGKKDVIVNSLIKGSGQPIKVDWRVRDNKVIDVIVEGVSMSVTQRNDFASIIQNNGGEVSALINHLKK